jgi:hypothetical protein
MNLLLFNLHNSTRIFIIKQPLGIQFPGVVYYLRDKSDKSDEERGWLPSVVTPAIQATVALNPGQSRNEDGPHSDGDPNTTQKPLWEMMFF